MSISVEPTELPEVRLVIPRVFGDARGFFKETFHAGKYGEAGLPERFVQDNHSRSARGVLRGLHYQLHQPQGKLVWAVRGAIFDVAVDIRRGSPRFGRWAGRLLTGDNHHQLYIPPGFAHGFYVLSDMVDVMYKCTDLYAPDDEYGLAWNDPAVAIEWPLEGEPLLSDKDRAFADLPAIPEAHLPEYVPSDRSR